MKSKEVVKDVLNHVTPEYIPLGTYAIDSDTAEKIIGHETYVRNKAKIQIALWEGRRDEVAQSLKEDSVELFKKLDCIDVIIPYKEASILPPKNYKPKKVKKIGDGTWEDENGIIYKYSIPTNHILPVTNPPVNKNIPEEEKELIPPDESIFEAYDHLIGSLNEERIFLGLSGGLDVMPLIGGMENGLIEYLDNPEKVKKIIKSNVRRENFLDGYYLQRGVDYAMIENDFAATNGPLISPDTFREFVLPAMKQRISNIRKYMDKVVFHCCGNTFKLLDMFIEAGVDCSQSLQTTAGMDIRTLKEKFGKKMCFWGGVSVERLISGTMEEVRQDVRYSYRYASEDGGFILGPSHSIAFGVNYDNFMAMLDEHSKLKYLK